MTYHVNNIAAILLDCGPNERRLPCNEENVLKMGTRGGCGVRLSRPSTAALMPHLALLLPTFLLSLLFMYKLLHICIRFFSLWSIFRHFVFFLLFFLAGCVSVCASNRIRVSRSSLIIETTVSSSLSTAAQKILAQTSQNEPMKRSDREKEKKKGGNRIERQDKARKRREDKGDQKRRA